MKNINFNVLVKIAILMLATECIGRAQGFFTNKPASPSPQMSSGSNTVGLSSEIILVSSDSNQLPIVDVRVFNTNRFGFYGEKRPDDAREVMPVMKKLFSEGFLYFRPTNLFCGPIELQDSFGKKIPSSKPRVISDDPYPSVFSLNVAREHNPSSAMLFPSPLVNSPDLLARFEVGDYFDVKEPGEYKLTVWPKIYKRLSADDDKCQRIDLPPVTAIIKVDAVK
jgi:hypothetical protein